jgi:hypothetical protein
VKLAAADMATRAVGVDRSHPGGSDQTGVRSHGPA